MGLEVCTDGFTFTQIFEDVFYCRLFGKLNGGFKVKILITWVLISWSSIVSAKTAEI